MQDLSTIWGSIASKIANAVGEKLSTQLGQSAKRMQPAGKLAKQSLGAFAKILQPHNPDPLASIQGMFQQIMQGLRGSGKSAKSHLAQDGQSLFGGGKQSDFWTHFFPPRVPKLTGGGQPGNAQASPPSADNGSSPQSSLPTIKQFFSWMTGRTGQRVEHLKEKAQSRLDAAAKHRESFGKTIGTADYDEKAHKVAIKAEKAATERLAQATTLEGRATLTGAGASSKVAAALGNLGGGLLGLAGRFALPAALATTVIKLPWTLANMAGARIGHLREQGEFMGGTAAIGTKFDRMTDQLGARNSRDTSASGQWLTDETNKLRSNLQPINSAFVNPGE